MLLYVYFREKEVQKCNLHQWTSVSTKFIVVVSAIKYSFHFLHISLPIDFCVFVIKTSQQNNTDDKKLITKQLFIWVHNMGSQK